MYITTASSQAETAYQLFMKETRATNTSLPKGKEAMVLIGEMWSKLPVGRRRPVRSFVQRHRCLTASETFTRLHRKRKRAPTKIGQRSPGKNTNKNSPRTTPTKRRQRRRTPLRRPPRLRPRRSARSCVDQNFTARDSLVDFHTGKKSEDGGEKKKKKKSKKSKDKA